MSKASKDIEDINFILSEIQQFESMSRSDFRHYLGNSSIFSCLIPIPNSHGGEDNVICGKDAKIKFFELAKRHLKTQNELEKNVDIEQFIYEIIASFVQRFLKEGREVNKQQIEKMLSAVVKKLKRRQKALTHYIPCILVSANEPEEFDVGPVHFMRMEKFFLDYKADLEAERQRISPGEESSKLAGYSVDDLTKYFSSFEWVALVEVPECDVKISRERAELTVEAALDILKLFFGPSHGRKLRQGHVFRGKLSATAGLAREVDGSFNVSTSTAETQHVFADETWFQIISEEPGSWYLQAASSALSNYLDPVRCDSEIKQRFLDALAWYGQAVSEQMPSAQIIRYVAAWERLTITKRQEKDLKKTVTRRTALLSVDESQDFKKYLINAQEVYDYRSDLMHGSRSPFDRDLEDISQRAGWITKIVLQRSLEVFDLLVSEISNPKSSDLEKKYLSLEVRFLPDDL